MQDKQQAVPIQDGYRTYHALSAFEQIQLQEENQSLKREIVQLKKDLAEARNAQHELFRIATGNSHN